MNIIGISKHNFHRRRKFKLRKNLIVTNFSRNICIAVLLKLTVSDRRNGIKDLQLKDFT